MLSQCTVPQGLRCKMYSGAAGRQVYGRREARVYWDLVPLLPRESRVRRVRDVLPPELALPVILLENVCI